MTSIFCIFGILVIFLSIAWEQFKEGRGRLYDIVHARHRIAEHDASGAVIAYRWFMEDLDGSFRSMTSFGRSRGARWDRENLIQTSDRVPTAKNTHGFYAAKTPDSPILKPFRFPGAVKARVQLSGRVVESEYGFKGQHCLLLEIVEEA